MTSFVAAAQVVALALLVSSQKTLLNAKCLKWRFANYTIPYFNNSTHSYEVGPHIVQRREHNKVESIAIVLLVCKRGLKL